MNQKQQITIIVLEDIIKILVFSLHFSSTREKKCVLTVTVLLLSLKDNFL